MRPIRDENVIVRQFLDDSYRYCFLVGDYVTGEILMRDTQARCEEYRNKLLGTPGMLERVRAEVRMARGERADFNPEDEIALEFAIHDAWSQGVDTRVGPLLT